MILFLHNRYRTAGGEERVVEDLLWLTREHLGLDAQVLERRSSAIARPNASLQLLRGGARPDEVADAVRRTGARVVHAHNLQPAFGWRALAAARDAGARVVLHLHQYRLVCAVGTCFTEGADCTRCHGRNTLPGIRHNCRGSIPEAVVYGTALAGWQRRLVAQVDRFVVPSRFALERLHQLGAPVGHADVLPPPIRRFASVPPPARGAHALLATRLAPEKGIDVAVQACRIAGIELLIAGDGPERERWRSPPPGVTFLGRMERERLEALRQSALVELVPSRAAETFGLSAAEAMAAGLPVVGSDIGALAELLPAPWRVPAGDPHALAEAIRRVAADPDAPATALERVRQRLAPDVIAARLRELYRALEVVA